MRKSICIITLVLLLRFVYGQTADTVLNTKSYYDAGFTGDGLKIAVIDHNWKNIAAMQDSGVFPVDSQVTCYPEPCSSIGDPDTRYHGTACVEMIYKHAPDAYYYALDVDGDTDLFGDDFSRLLDSCIAWEVNIVSISVLDLRDSWRDGDGKVGMAIKKATDEGILVFIAAGNVAQAHWQGDFKNAYGNDAHEWDGSDTTNNFEIKSNGELQSYLLWDEPAHATTDWYDLILVDSITGNVLDSGVARTGQEFEKLEYTNKEVETIYAYLKVIKKKSGTPPELELYDFKGRAFQYRNPAGSINGMSSSQEPNCIAVAAVKHKDYNSGEGAHVITNYSSRGPTNEGNLGPELASVTNVKILSNPEPEGSPFTGTSCATPNAAGAAAAFWSSQLHYCADGVRQVILRKAELFKDWGSPGPDTVYGHGGIFLYDYYEDTEYVYFAGDNTLADSTKPWLTLQQADNKAPENSRVVILGGTHDTSGSILLDKPMLYVSLKKSAVIK